MGVSVPGFLLKRLTAVRLLLLIIVVFSALPFLLLDTPFHLQSPKETIRDAIGSSDLELDLELSNALLKYSSNPTRVVVVLGTRPEVIKLAPVVRELKNLREIDTIVVFTNQHADLL